MKVNKNTSWNVWVCVCVWEDYICKKIQAEDFSPLPINANISHLKALHSFHVNSFYGNSSRVSRTRPRAPSDSRPGWWVAGVLPEKKHLHTPVQVRWCNKASRRWNVQGPIYGAQMTAETATCVEIYICVVLIYDVVSNDTFVFCWWGTRWERGLSHPAAIFVWVEKQFVSAEKHLRETAQMFKM